jgi:two-component system cell cycle response regulator
MSRPHVLVVEDSVFISQQIADKLSDQYDFATSTAESAADARAALEASDIDCLLVKHNLPDESGMELSASIESDVPVILLTSSAVESVAMDALQAGVSEFFHKDNLSEETVDVLANRIDILVDLYGL